MPGTVSVITARMDYCRATGTAPPVAQAGGWQAMELQRLQRPPKALSRCTPGARLSQGIARPPAKLSDRIAEAVGPFGHRVFTDSAPVLEAELAARSGQGWRGKHTLVLNREAGSTFFWARSTWTWPCRHRARHRPLRQLQRLHRCLPHAGHRGAPPRGCAALHLLPDH